MRDALLFLMVFSTIPFILKRPAYGVMVFAWISLMNPHRLTYGSAYDFPFAALITVLTVVSLAMSKQRKSFPVAPATVMLIVFACWMTLTTFFAYEPTLAWPEWNRVMKTYLMIAITLMAVREERDIKLLAWVVGLSLGFWGLKGGVFTIVSGGHDRVLGPAGSYIGDNNALALALITSLPMIWYLQMQVTRWWQRLPLMGVAAATLLAAAGSYSRGALLAGGAMLVFLWLKSRSKVRTGLALLLVVPVIFAVMPEQWFHRMDTIETYKQDSSAMGRINAWGFATNVAKDNILGGGYVVFTPRMFHVYAPDPLNHHAAHSIYFQVLGEHGFIGLGMFITFLLLSWRTGSRVIAFCKDKPELRWAANLAAMCQVSMIGYMVGGAFLTLAYYDLPYYIIAIMVLLERLLIRKGAARSAVPAAAVPAGVRT